MNALAHIPGRRAPAGTALCLRSGGSRIAVISVPSTSSISPDDDAGRVVQMSFKVFFADQWQRFVRAHPSSDTELAAEFGVTEQAVRNWRAGGNGPNGAVTCQAMMHYPEFARRLAGWRG